MTEVAAGPKDSYPARWGPTGGLTLAVIRHGAETRRREDLADIARAAAVAEQARHSPELLDTIVNGRLHARC
jgi:hypothetical protein